MGVALFNYITCTQYTWVVRRYGGNYLEVMEDLRDGSLEPLLATRDSELRNSRRLVSRKNGRSLARHVNLWTRFPRFVKDHFTTLVNARWYIIFTIVSACFVCSWLMFAVLWLIIANINDHCVASANNEVLKSFSTALLFAVETQVTIGYGELFIQSQCTLGVCLLLVQCLFAYFMEAFLIGLIFTKLSRPRQRAKTILFSDKFIVCNKQKLGVQQDEGVTKGVSVQHSEGVAKSLRFRIADIRYSQLVEAHVRLYLYWNKCCHGNTNKVLQQYELNVGYDSGYDRVFLLLPVEIAHVIHPDSPLHDWSNEMFEEEDYELVVVLEGIVEATGMTSQVIWSYLPSEVCFNHQFCPMVQRHKGEWQVDFCKLNHMTSLND